MTPGTGAGTLDWVGQRYSVSSPLHRPSPADAATLRAQGAMTVLFVHGHLGTHQQMRSMASETCREVVKRFNAGGGGPAQRWVQWYSTDFSAEPSATEPHLAVSC